MRYVSNLPPPVIDLGGNEVKGVEEVRPVGTERIRSRLFSETGQYNLHEQTQRLPLAYGQNEAGRRTVFPEERRKVNLRVRRQPVLLEFRSGIDRRRRHLRATDWVEHIDEEV